MAYREERVTVLTWTDQIVADGVADDDATLIDLGLPEALEYVFDTTGATTGAPNFDFHVLASADGVAWTTADLQTIGTAVPKADRRTVVGTTFPRFIKVLADVNGAALVEFVKVTVYAYHKTP